MTWRITHDPAGNAPPRDHAVPASSIEAAMRKLAAALNVPPWTPR